ncbi:hypothetical protein EJ02DRAFT_507396 [Clathrospora elynae]|uniref:Transposase Tc1-like domain-containing protein n=1 Tax=Clathrospora elynae TaxID=706981 RepID=A0A6A5S5D5_9PLEO|nr:hypothetical protein EJ02DRAFT_507396 [Clathrospora elynae]
MANLKRRKPFKYKANKAVKIPKTTRKEMTPIQRAFIAGAVIAARDGYASANALAKQMDQTQPGISKVVRTVERRAKEGGFNLWEDILYQNDLGRGRSALLTQGQKDEIIKIVTSSQANRKKESWQAIKDEDFKEVANELGVSTFENIMYEAGYSRKKPGWKPPLTRAQKRERLQWALDHNPDLHKEYDNKGYNFRQVVFTDETPARIGDQQGMIRTWCKEDELYHNHVKKDRKPMGSALQFFGAFRYGHKGPCHVYYHETQEEIKAGEKALAWENLVTKAQANSAQMSTRKALQVLNVADLNLRQEVGWIAIVTVKERSRRLFHGFKTSKDKEFHVYYLKMELLHTSHALLMTTSLWKRWRKLHGQDTLQM